MKTGPICPAAMRLAENRVWRTYLGGSTLDRIAGKTVCEDTHFPEDWILSSTRAVNAGREDIVEGESQVLLPDGAAPLSQVLRTFPEAMFGAKHLARFGTDPRFLLKYLDSSVRLHIQCHPTIPFAKKFLNSDSGKSEAYYILGIRPGAEGYIYLGLQRPPERAAFRKMIVEQDIPALLGCFDKIPVRPGDAFFVPGGLPHAIGEGVFMVELMEPTDLAVRIEFERGGYVLPEKARFMDRGVDFALDMFDFRARSVADIRRDQFVTPVPLPISGKGTRSSLFDRRCTECFRAEEIVLAGDAEMDNDSFRVLVVTKGCGTLSADGTEMELAQYDRVLIPAATRRLAFRTGGMTLYSALPPEV